MTNGKPVAHRAQRSRKEVDSAWRADNEHLNGYLTVAAFGTMLYGVCTGPAGVLGIFQEPEPIQIALTILLWHTAKYIGHVGAAFFGSRDSES